MKIAFAFLLSMPGVPFIYYGDELGMRKLNIPSKEGGYNRTGSRTPMQWDSTANAGFSSASPDLLYLPIDVEKKDSINAEAEKNDPDSLYNTVHKLIGIRRAHSALANTSDFELISDGYPLIYKRRSATEEILVVINPSARKKEAALDGTYEVIYQYHGEEGTFANNLIVPACSVLFLKKKINSLN